MKVILGNSYTKIYTHVCISVYSFMSAMLITLRLTKDIFFRAHCLVKKYDLKQSLMLHCSEFSCWEQQ